MSTKVAPNTLTLEVKRLIKAPRERVFAAWTTPDQIMKWFGSENCRMLSVTMDPRVGGAYRIRSRNESSGEHEVTGVFREVRRPSRLVYTWIMVDGAMAGIGETVVTVDFLEVKEGTEVRLRHEGFPAAEPRDQHNHGWNGCFDKLEKLFAESCAAVGEFSWNELLAQDVKASGAFYSKLFGWKAEPFDPSGTYVLFKSGDTQVGGMMKCPMPGVPTHWLAYVTVASCDASVKAAKGLGARVVVEPKDIPTVGRIAVIIDPEGASFGVFQPARN
ncbi:MAG TPA: SRPBCC domain-containing protein [Verrucomicrobiae bacterium]|nr:SRPBCC domain-containing protein [Verrucomicrobiae bacterium]